MNTIFSTQDSITKDMRIRQEDLLDNPTHRIPVVLCLDVSGSMTGEKIEELNAGVREFFEQIRSDPTARASAEVAVVVFGDRAVTILDFQSLGRIETPPRVEVGGVAGGTTNLGAGVQMSLDLLERCKRQYRSAGIDYFQPFLVLMTDGQPTTLEHQKVAPRTCELELQKRLVVFPIGIGQDADMSVLSMFSTIRSPLRLRGLHFREFFRWLSKSVVQVSQSRPGERIALDTTGVSGWAML